MQKVAIFDIDGTVVIPHRAKICKRLCGRDLHSFLVCFCSDMFICFDEPDPETVEYMHKLKKEGYVIVLVSGRLERYRKSFEEQLRSWNVPFDALYLNSHIRNCPNGELMLKRELFLMAAHDFGAENVVEIHDDNPMIERAARKVFPNAKFVLHDRYSLKKFLEFND